MTYISRYLALDLGQSTGYALAEGGRIIKSGIRDFSVKRSELPGKRGIMFYNWLQSLGRVDEIYYEKIQFGGGNFKDKETGKWRPGASGDHHEFYHGLKMLMEMYASCYGLHPIAIHPSTLKKDFTGYGKAEKHDMCQAAHTLGWQGGASGTDNCHDEADAIGMIATQLLNRYGTVVRF